jgi:hypothetical protein
MTNWRTDWSDIELEGLKALANKEKSTADKAKLLEMIQRIEDKKAAADEAAEAEAGAADKAAEDGRN